MGDVKVNTVNTKCPSFYKEKVKASHKGSKVSDKFRKFFENLKGQK